tara:strand:- start:2946 stop:3140 length:195 start_codon:yes stop_codon:yes gene_type:complete
MAKSYDDEVTEIANAIKVVIKYLPKSEQIETTNKIFNQFIKESMDVLDFKLEQLIKDHRLTDET